MSIWIISFKSSYDKLLEEKLTMIESNNIIEFQDDRNYIKEGSNEIEISFRKGGLSHLYYIKRSAQIDISPMPHQSKIMNIALAHYKNLSRCVILLHGPPGTGKSMIGILLANQLKGIHCDSARFWEPGDNPDTLYSDLNINSKSPLVLTFDEIDRTISEINVGITPHKNIPIFIRNKDHWNKFFDKINLGFYRNIIVILTTNKTPSEINKIDPSYLRKGRVDYIYEMNDVILGL
jgi:hypothetical protein